MTFQAFVAYPFKGTKSLDARLDSSRNEIVGIIPIYRSVLHLYYYNNISDTGNFLTISVITIY